MQLPALIQKSKTGSAIIIVLIISLIASALTLFSVSLNRKIIKSTYMLMDKLHTQFIAESTIKKIEYYASTGKFLPNAIKNNVQGLPSVLFIDGNSQKIDNNTTVIIKDAGSMLDIWFLDTTILNNLLSFANVPQNRSRRIIDSYLDWIDKDNIPRLNGAESGYYLSKGYKYTPRNYKTLQSIYELKLLRGVDNKTFDYIKKYLVFSPRWHININTVDENMMAALLGISKPMAKALIDLRRQKGKLSLYDIKLKTGKVLNPDYYSAFPTFTLDIYVRVRFNEAMENRSCIISFYPGKSSPYRILRWLN